MAEPFEKLLLKEFAACAEGLGGSSTTLLLPTLRALLRISAGNGISGETKRTIAAQCEKVPSLLEELSTRLAQEVASELAALANSQDAHQKRSSPAGAGDNSWLDTSSADMPYGSGRP